MYLTLELWNIVPHSTSRNKTFSFRAPHLNCVSLTLGPACHFDFRAGPQALRLTSLPSSLTSHP